MRPIWKRRRGASIGDHCGPQQKAALRSLIANRQWPQERLFRSQLPGVKHSRCNFCVAAYLQEQRHWGPTPCVQPPTFGGLDEQTGSGQTGSGREADGGGRNGDGVEGGGCVRVGDGGDGEAPHVKKGAGLRACATDTWRARLCG